MPRRIVLTGVGGTTVSLDRPHTAGEAEQLLHEISQVWEAADAHGATAQSEAERGKAVGIQCRCAVITASIHHLATPRDRESARNSANDIPNDQAERSYDAHVRAQILARIATLMPPHEQTALVETVLQLWKEFDNRYWGEELSTFLEALETVLPLTLPLPRLHAPVVQALSTAIYTYGEWEAEGLAKMLPYLAGAQHAIVRAEALEFARSQSDYGKRATRLLAIAGYLDPDEQRRAVDEALEAIRRMGTAEDTEWDNLPRLQYWQTKHLAALVPHLMPDHRWDVLREALHIAQHIADNHTRSWALQELSLEIAKLGHVAAAVECAVSIRDDYFRAWALRDIAPYLDPPLLHRVFQVVRGLTQASHRAWLLAALVPQLGKQGKATQALAMARQLPDGPGPWGSSSRADALAYLAPYLPPELVADALPVARALQNEWSRARTLVRLAPKLIQTGALDEAVSAALAYIHAMNWPTLWHDEGPHFALLDLVLQLDPALSAMVLNEALESARAVEGYGTRADAFAKLLPALVELPPPLLYPLWSTTLHALAKRPRTDLMADLHGLAPVIAALGGTTGLHETARAVNDVGNWFE